MSRSNPPPCRLGGLSALALGLLFAAGCDGEAARPAAEDVAAAEEREPYAFESVEEMEIELEVLDHEIRGLEEYLAANPDWVPPDPTDPDPRAILEAARATRDAAGVALDGADTARAVDSLHAASARIEHAKRLLGVAEEMGIEFEPAAESLPPVD
jgi:hypothetical protein